MERSKQQALMFLLGAVLVGGALGFTADRVIARDPQGIVSDRENRIRFYNAISLDASQRAQFDSILEARDAQYREALGPLRPRLREIKEHARSAMRSRLSDAQRQRFERLLAQQKQDSAQGR